MDPAEFLRARYMEEREFFRSTWAGLALGIPMAARLLRDVEAKLRIVDECWTDLYAEHPEIPDRLNLRVLALLTVPYTDHRDYDPEWKV